MASKALYTVVAVVGIAAASGAAWWYQNKPAKPAETQQAGGSAGPGRPVAGGAGSGPGAAGGPGRAPAVEVAKVQVMKLVDETQAVGSLRSRQSVVLRPEVSGRITQINFRDGEQVRRGQLLVQLDDQLQLAQMQQSQAELSIAQANHKRNQELVAQNFISQRSVDESSANLEVAQAKLALARATAARLRIVAPFDGVAGIRGVNLGDYLKDGADIVNIEDMQALYVDFRLPERFQTKAKRGQVASVTVDALPGRKFSAVVQAIDPLVDANGRSLGLRACIDNRAFDLRPGMFARVNAVFGERADAPVIPEEAIVPQGGRQFVLKVVDGPDKDSKMAQRVEVQVGMRQPGKVEILRGLQPGDTVVTAGHQRVQGDGVAVRVVDLSRPAGGGNAASPGAGPRPGGAAVPQPAAAAAPAVAAVPAVPALRAASPRPEAGANPCAMRAAS
jgi:membrane fusion protein (multidrug efflux system)